MAGRVSNPRVVAAIDQVIRQLEWIFSVCKVGCIVEIFDLREASLPTNILLCS